MAELKEMYKGQANSPQTTLSKRIGSTDTVIELTNVDALPAGPNLAVLGVDEEAETIFYATKTSNALSGCKRGFEGSAKSWEADTLISRNFTNYDYSTLIENINKLNNTKIEQEALNKLKESLNNDINTFKQSINQEVEKKATTSALNKLEANIDKKLDNKVSKVSGKGLSTNDYTNEDKAEVAKVKNKANRSEIKTKLAELNDDSSHRLVSDAEKEVWNSKAEKSEIKTKLAEMTEDSSHRTVSDSQISKWNDKAEITDIKTKLAEMTEDSSHRTVTDSEKATWNNKVEKSELEELKESLGDNENDDRTNAPGPKKVIAGDRTQGYFGIVKDELPSGTELARLCGITEGTAQFSDEGYLKFILDGKILFKSKKPFRHSISWDHICEKGCVYGKGIKYKGVHYKVRLMKGHNEHTVQMSDENFLKHDGCNCWGSEWNRLMLPIHEKAKNRDWKKPDNVEKGEVPNNWGINFSDKDLVTNSNAGNGSCHWCQETITLSDRLRWGYVGVSCASCSNASFSGSDYGWSPVLEVIE